MLTDNALLFSWMNNLALIGWALLILTPKRWTWLMVSTGIVIPTILGIAYGALMLMNFADVEGGGYSSLQQVKALMSDESVLVAGWAHYLCFDLLVGTFIAKESDKRGIVRLIQIPILLATFMFGPVGFVLFLITCGTGYLLQSRGNV